MLYDLFKRITFKYRVSMNLSTEFWISEIISLHKHYLIIQTYII